MRETVLIVFYAIDVLIKGAFVAACGIAILWAAIKVVQLLAA